ncbi:MAG TPA: L-seryl-tRNA(Sec) selenium transferase, partial [Vicinamibacteria bacterium]|nr:L-seryl-tRNA(Sec) selenium transferase [Vicinamibacteria bacterium]
LRVDKMTLAALDVVLGEHEKGRAATSLPALRMLHEDEASVRARADHLAGLVRDAVGAAASITVVAGRSAVGGGALPTAEIPTALVAVAHPTLSPDRLASDLRRGEPPVVARVADGRLLIDLRTVLPGDIQDLTAVLVPLLLRS